MPVGQEHWNAVYSGSRDTNLSWFEPTPAASLRALTTTGLGTGARGVDVGGGASVLVDHMVQAGFTMTVVDLASAGLAVARKRLGTLAGQVEWVVADVTQWRPATPFDFWHDRAVFHFLTAPLDQDRYIQTAAESIRPGGWLILATFASDGPERCSGLPVQRWNATELANKMEDRFVLRADWNQRHTTPSGAIQPFTWTVFQRSHNEPDGAIDS